MDHSRRTAFRSRLLNDVLEPLDGRNYSRDPRRSPKNAEKHPI